MAANNSLGRFEELAADARVHFVAGTRSEEVRAELLAALQRFHEAPHVAPTGPVDDAETAYAKRQRFWVTISARFGTRPIPITEVLREHSISPTVWVRIRELSVQQLVQMKRYSAVKLLGQPVVDQIDAVLACHGLCIEMRSRIQLLQAFHFISLQP